MTAPAGQSDNQQEALTGQVGMTHRFVVAIDEGPYDLGSWTKVTGLTVKWDKHTYRPGSANAETILPGNVSYSDITLSRAACADSKKVQSWLVATTRTSNRHSGAIHMVDHNGTFTVTWQLKEFFPIGWQITEFDAGAARPALETLTLAHNGFLDDEAR
jgi:phage tail-like protein